MIVERNPVVRLWSPHLSTQQACTSILELRLFGVCIHAAQTDRHTYTRAHAHTHTHTHTHTHRSRAREIIPKNAASVVPCRIL